MAEFSAITIGENTYDIKDATARTGLAGKQNTLTAGTGISIVGDVISATGGGGLPDNTITYSQFIQMSDAEQLAFTGYVTDYPGIDDEPVADDVIYDNTDSGLTANNVQDAIDEVNDRVIELEKEHILEFDINNVAITTAWGEIYTSSEISLSISSLGLSVAPKVISLLYIDQTGGVAFPIFSRISTDALKIDLARGTSATVTGKIVAVLRY